MSKLVEKRTTIEKITIKPASSELRLYNINIHNEKNFTYNSLFRCDEIILSINLKTLFSENVIFDKLVIKNPNFYFEIADDILQKEDNKSKLKDNLSIIEKTKLDYKPKIHPPKKKDKNFIINNVQLLNSKASIKFLEIYEYKNFELSNMLFSNVGNSESNSQHYKEIFKIFLLDIFLRIPDFEIRKKIKQIYGL